MVSLCSFFWYFLCSSNILIAMYFDMSFITNEGYAIITTLQKQSQKRLVSKDTAHKPH